MLLAIVLFLGVKGEKMKLFDFLSPTYHEVSHLLEGILPDNLSGVKMLDLASGEGHHLQVFFDKNIQEIHAIDSNKIRLENLLSRYSKNQDKIKIIHDNIFERNYQSRFDLVYLGDNSIQIFDTHSDQYKVINVIANTLKSTGIGIINFTPIVEKNILDYGNAYKPINGINDSLLCGKIKVDIFNQEIIYYFKDNTITRTIKSRILLKKELEDMINCTGLEIVKVVKRACKSGNPTYFYCVKLNIS